VFGKVIPHGTADAVPVDPIDGCEWLGVDPQDTLLLVPGFVSQYKAVLATIRSFLDAVPQLPPTTRLVIAGRPDGRAYGRVTVPAEVARNPEQIIYRPGYVPAATLRALAAASTWAILNTTSSCGSSSGQFHSLCRYVPLAVASRPIYDQAAAAGALQYFTDGSQESQPHMASTILHLVGATLTAAKVLKLQQRYAGLTSWANLVKTYYAPLYKWAAAPPAISGTEVE
jgi:hypothetical protein